MCVRACMCAVYTFMYMYVFMHVYMNMHCVMNMLGYVHVVMHAAGRSGALQPVLASICGCKGLCAAQPPLSILYLSQGGPWGTLLFQEATRDHKPVAWVRAESSWKRVGIQGAAWVPLPAMMGPQVNKL